MLWKCLIVYLLIIVYRYTAAEEATIRPRISKITVDFVKEKSDLLNQKINNVKSYFPNFIIDKFSNNIVLKPIQDKIEKISEILATQIQPSYSYGSFQKFDPQNLIDKIHEKSLQLLTGAKASIYGLHPIANYDYPFAYRRSLNK